MLMKRVYTFIFAIYSAFVSIDGVNQYICEDGTQIRLDQVCNGKVDCPDGSDEVKKICYHIICPHNMFRCRYGACVHQVTKCNGKYECADKSDESQCGRKTDSCEKNEFRCDNGQCININKMCDGQEDCADGSDEIKETCEEFPCPEGAFHCKHGGCIHQEARCNGYQDCVDGSDESERLCKTLRKCPNGQCPGNMVTCPPITSNRLRVTCQNNKKGIVSCNKPVSAETIAMYECKPFYQPINEKHLKNTKAVCQLDGSWNREILKCIPECGKSGPDGIPMVVKGWTTKAGRYPWYAALYVKEDGEWMFWCGGSLISEKIVVTAGHCTWQITPGEMKVGLGKYYSNISKIEDYTQIINVKNITIHPLYQDLAGNYGSDIAILELEHSAELSQFVLPICMDWERRDMDHHLQENSIGLIVGMGVNENDTFSTCLRGTYLPVAANDKCIKEQKQDFKKYITFTSFCAGWKNGTGVCNGDSGGGLVFPKLSNKNQMVLEGIVSISPRRLGTSFCDPKYYTVFTKIGIYLDWIKKVLHSVHPEHSSKTGVLESAYNG